MIKIIMQIKTICFIIVNMEVMDQKCSVLVCLKLTSTTIFRHALGPSHKASACPARHCLVFFPRGLRLAMPLMVSESRSDQHDYDDDDDDDDADDDDVDDDDGR